MNSCCCTIVTEDYLPLAFALNESLQNTSRSAPRLYVLVCKADESSQRNVSVRGNMTLLPVAELCSNGIGRTIKDRYFDTSMDAFRWSMKPVLINYLIRKYSYGKVLFLDCDTFFFHDYSFLLDLLDHHSVLLCPHFRSSDPGKDYFNYILQFNSGIYNAGFLGVNHKGTAAMDWLAHVCSLICEINPCKGQFVDQTHLNLIPVYFDKTHVLRHRGCNVANWNQLECKRVVQPDGTVLINNEYPVIFIHFTASTIRGILSNEDGALRQYLEGYAQTLRKYNKDLDIIAKHTKTNDQKMTFRQRLASKILKGTRNALGFIKRFAKAIT